MTDQSYRVVFEGAIAEGFSIGMVKKNLAKLFKADNDRIATIFSGQPVVLKKNVDEATALKYQAALLKAGAATVIRSTASQVASAPTQQATVATAASTNKAPRTNQPAQQTDDWSLAPTGSMLLRENERDHTEELDIELSHISLASSFLVPETNSAPPPPPPDTSHISVADPGATLGESHGTGQTEALVGELDATLAPVGSDMGDRAPEPDAPALDLSHLSIEATESSSTQ